MSKPRPIQYKELETWSKFVSRKSIWSYWRIYTGDLYPFVKPRKDIAAEFRFCVKNDVYSYFGENEAMQSRSFSVQQHYLGLKMMDDPTQDIDKLNDRFMKGYYGAAAPFMQQYLEYLEKRQKEDRSFLDREFFEKVNGWLDAAENAVRNDDRSSLHVRCERVIVDRTMFLRLEELMKQGFRTNLKAVSARFLKNGLDQVTLWTVNNSKLRARMKEALRGEADLYSHYPVAIPEQFKGCDVIDMHWNQLQRSTENAVKDPDAVCGMAVRNPKVPQKLPYRMGFYSVALRKGNSLELQKDDIPQDEKFHWYKLGRIKILAMLYIHYDNLWHFRTYLPTIGILGEDRDIWVSAKFQGKPWVEGSQKPCAVLFDRVLLVNDPDPLREYKPIDPAKNLLKNGDFETAGAKGIDHWQKYGDRISIDTNCKKIGNSALRIDGTADGNFRVLADLGKIEDLKNDLLVRGWCKYENLAPEGLPFIGLWPMDRYGGNVSYTISAVEIYKGTYDWYYFERLVKIDELKKIAAKTKPRPAAKLGFRVGMYHQAGTLWVDGLEVIPLEKK